ncbi:MAG: hypothetical protein ACOYXM_06235 [Actinomycetota bacterium]
MPDQVDENDGSVPSPVEFEPEPEGSSQWARRYPPLLSMIGALLIAILVMPSSLNLPQSNPSQTVEYAPVPPEDSDDPPPAQGNLSNLGLTGSNGPSGDGPGSGAGTLPPPIGDGVGEVVSDKRCVGNPPRQTEDPLSPPCVAYWDPESDNFGATYQGVTEDEIRVLIYLDGNIRDIGTARGTEVRPSSTYYDLVNDPPKDDDQVWVRAARGWQKYFNERYQTYGRFVHFYVYFSSSDQSPEGRRADAADNFNKVKPFATISLASFNGGGDAYLDSTAKRGVLNFGSFLGQEASFYARYPKLIWGFLPSLEIQAQQYADVLCGKYVGQPVDHSPQFNGQPRKFGLYYTTDPGFDTLRRFKDSVKKRFQECGGTIVTEQTFPKAGYAVDNSNTPRYASDAALAFQQAGVTTIIWPAGQEAKLSQAAARINYFPEIILAGDGQTDGDYAQATQEPTFWDNVMVVSNQPLEPELVKDQLCFQAYRSSNPDSHQRDAGAYACDLYTNLRQLFIGIQVAGPRLGPTSIDKGFHAIPAIRSSDAQTPACYYLTNDYTCVKDYVLGLWDSAARADPQRPGCYRFAQGARYLLGEVPPGNATAQSRPDDPCLGYAASQQTDPNPPNSGDL